MILTHGLPLSRTCKRLRTFVNWFRHTATDCLIHPAAARAPAFWEVFSRRVAASAPLLDERTACIVARALDEHWFRMENPAYFRPKEGKEVVGYKQQKIIELCNSRRTEGRNSFLEFSIIGIRKDGPGATRTVTALRVWTLSGGYGRRTLSKTCPSPYLGSCPRDSIWPYGNTCPQVIVDRLLGGVVTQIIILHLDAALNSRYANTCIDCSEAVPLLSAEVLPHNSRGRCDPRRPSPRIFPFPFLLSNHTGNRTINSGY